MRCELVAEHASAAFALSSIAGWNQTIDDWRLLLKASAACYGAEIDGRLVATATLICYERTLAWIGMVLTHPEFRRRGLARELVSHLLERAKELGVETVKLDATDEGRGLYESLGFQAEQAVERWQLGSGCDQAVSDAHVTGDGYILDRPGRICRYLGPCVAVDRNTAHSLIEGAIARHPDSGRFWDLLPANRDAVAIAQNLGFVPVRRLTRMVWGSELPVKEENIFAIRGFEFG